MTRINRMAPLDCFPTGLISWYAAGERPAALITSWFALIGGRQPRIRTAWAGVRCVATHFSQGGDFVLNVLDDFSLPAIRKLFNLGRFYMDDKEELVENAVPGLCFSAPRLVSCGIQIECCKGRFSMETHEVELVGEVAVVHRGPESFLPGQFPGFGRCNFLRLP